MTDAATDATAKTAKAITNPIIDEAIMSQTTTVDSGISDSNVGRTCVSTPQESPGGDGRVSFGRVWGDPNVQNVLRAVAIRFSRQLDDHELESCAIDAVIKVVRYYRSTHARAVSLTTAAHRAMLQVCRNHWDSVKRARRRAARAAEREAERHRQYLDCRPAGDDSRTPEDAQLVLQRIQPEYSQIIRLRFVDGLSLEDIAARLRIRAADADVRLRRALDTARFAAGLAPA